MKLYSDGGARGNPGPSAGGAVLFDADGAEVLLLTISIGTNNKAEYSSTPRPNKCWPRQIFSIDCI
jgi:ribonuclease HI